MRADCAEKSTYLTDTIFGTYKIDKIRQEMFFSIFYKSGTDAFIGDFLRHRKDFGTNAGDGGAEHSQFF